MIYASSVCIFIKDYHVLIIILFAKPVVAYALQYIVAIEIKVMENDIWRSGLKPLIELSV